MSSSKLNCNAATFTPKGSGRENASLMTPLSLPATSARLPRHYTRDELEGLRRRMRHGSESDRLVDSMLNALLKHHMDLVNPEMLALLAKRQAFPETCFQCIGKICPSFPGGPPPPAAWLDPPCQPVADIIASVIAEVRSRHGVFLLQDPIVVFGLLRIELMLLYSPLVRHLKAQAPRVLERIKSFLCGDGFHFPPPRPNSPDSWRSLMSLLCFDAMRDNTTGVFTELSKNWQKRTTPFEQFTHFLFFRDEEPPHSTYGMITQAQKPLLVAALRGDTSAFVLLARLGFTVLPDALWERTSMIKNSLDARRYAVLRHLNTYFFRKQFERPAPAAAAVMLLRSVPNPSAIPPSPPVPPSFLVLDSYPFVRAWEQHKPRVAAPRKKEKASPMNNTAFDVSLPFADSTANQKPPITPPMASSSWVSVARSNPPVKPTKNAS